jgi:hypothetical protein
MAEFGALNELQNQQRPARRHDKTYGKKKAPTAEKRAMHFDLFGGGGDENEAVQKTGATKDDENIVNKMEKLTLIEPAREISVQPGPESTVSIKQKPTDHNPRLRGRRKLISQKKMAVSSPTSMDLG